jgi:hypothetical protein
MKARKIVQSFTLTGFVFGFAGWVYIVLNSEIHPRTLPLQLTHFAKWPREDTFGETCFLVAAICFFVYNLVKDRRQPRP